jgi:thioredoxin 1
MSDRSRRAPRFTSENTDLVSTSVQPAAAPRAGRPVALALALSLSLGIAAGLSGAAPAAAADAGRGRATLSGSYGSEGKVLKVSGYSFDRQVLRSDVPVIVDFWAPWCIVCRELDGPLAAVAAKFAGRVRVVRVNIDWSSGVASRYGVQSLPTVLVFKHGELVSKSIGGASQQDLEEMLAEPLAPTPVATAAAAVTAAATAPAAALPAATALPAAAASAAAAAPAAAGQAAAESDSAAGASGGTSR